MIIIKIIVALLAIQASRAGLTRLIQVTYEPAMLYINFALIVIGAVLYLVVKPDIKSLGLDFNCFNKRKRKAYVIITVIILLLAISSPSNFSGNVEDIMSIFESVIIFPVFEELVFRGYIWSRLEERGLSNLKAYVLTTVLFGLWHLGYWDVVYFRTNQSFSDISINQVMLWKVFVGMGYGVFTGFTRLKTKNSYSSILLHSFLNIFGR